jgi:hypothetical protein
MCWLNDEKTEILTCSDYHTNWNCAKVVISTQTLSDVVSVAESRQIHSLATNYDKSLIFALQGASYGIITINPSTWSRSTWFDDCPSNGGGDAQSWCYNLQEIATSIDGTYLLATKYWTGIYKFDITASCLQQFTSSCYSLFLPINAAIEGLEFTIDGQYVLTYDASHKSVLKINLDSKEIQTFDISTWNPDSNIHAIRAASDGNIHLISYMHGYNNGAVVYYYPDMYVLDASGNMKVKVAFESVQEMYFGRIYDFLFDSHDSIIVFAQ